EHGMSAARPRAASRSQPQLEDRLDSARERVAHPARDEPEGLIQRPHGDIAFTSLEKLAQCRFRSVIGAADPSIGRQTSTVAQVRELRLALISLALLRLTGELREREDGNTQLL